MDIKIYTIPTCKWCDKLRTWLRRRHLPFTEMNIIDDEKYRNELLDKTSQLSVPVIQVDHKIMIGFDEEKLKEVLGKK